MSLCVCGHQPGEHMQFEGGEYCMDCGCQKYRKAADVPTSTAPLPAGVTPEGLAGATVSGPVNEAAERLRRAMLGDSPFTSRFTTAEMLDAALATERRNTVERIRARLGTASGNHGDLGLIWSVAWVSTVLDEVAS